MTIKALMVLAALAASQTVSGQQAATPQPAQQQTAAPTPAPCTPAPKPPKGFHFGIPPQIQQALDVERQKIQKQTGQTVPSSGDLKQDLQPKPCPAPGKTQPDNKQKTVPPKQAVAPVTPASQITTPDAKPALVCPPKTVLIANTPYCLAADHTTVDAIPLPANQPLPAAPQH